MISSRTPDRASLRLLEHREEILAEAHGFGSLLFDSGGRLVAPVGATSLYTTALESGRWTSWRRDLDLSDLSSGPPSRVLVPAGDDRDAVIHHVIELDDGRALAFYSNGLGVRAGLGPTAAGPFTKLEGFALDPESAWELLDGSLATCSLEANGAYVAIEETERSLEFWEGYDSYHPAEKRGDLGWARLRLDKVAGTLAVVARHPGNPLRLRPVGWACARCGGNLAADVMVGGAHSFFYYLRPDPERVRMAVVTGPHPLFLGSQTPVLYDELAGREVLAEKFQKVLVDGDLLLFYESKHADGSWHTAVRRYALP